MRAIFDSSMLMRAAAAVVGLAAAGCGSPAMLPVVAGTGPSPSLPSPEKSLVPTIHVADAVGWPDAASPTAAPSLRVTRFADHLDHPRWLYVLPNGDVLVAESNGPERPEDNPGGIRGWLMNHYF